METITIAQTAFSTYSTVYDICILLRGIWIRNKMILHEKAAHTVKAFDQLIHCLIYLWSCEAVSLQNTEKCSNDMKSTAVVFQIKTCTHTKVNLELSTTFLKKQQVLPESTKLHGK